ncbi:MAG TPA: hypothetical protein VFE17_02360 [Candidatus Baltobacteraceae bacterium]|nr:hypothetical protein [Candidatus Baltobacteraceae bacterium]
MIHVAFSVVSLLAQVTPAPSPSVTPLSSPSAAPITAPVSPAPSPSPSALPSPAASLTLSPPQVNLHPSQSQIISVANAAGPIAVTASAPLVSTTVDQAARTVTVAASTQTGSTVLTISSASGSARVPVRVALDAATVPPSIDLRVSGDQIDAPWLLTQIQNAVRAAVAAQPGAGPLQLGEIAPPTPFNTGAVASVTVPVRVAGGAQYFDVNGTTSINLQNLAVQAFAPPVLFYDDDPEKLVANGVLFRNEVTPAAAARLYYYHQNTLAPRQLAVVLRASSPARVQLIDASAGPNPDVMTVGHNVSRDFLVRKPRNQGVVVDLAAGAPYVAEQFSMNPVDGAAGSIGIQVLSGGPVQIATMALASTDAAQLNAYFDQPRLPGDGHARTGVFNLTGYGGEVLAYTAGGPDAVTQYGASSPPPAQPGSGHDYGDYGVIRTITFDLANSSPQPATVYLYERPMGGSVRSSFLVDGTLVQLGCARVPQRYQIGTPFSLPPGSNSRLVVQTMTDGGSSYPLEVGITSSPPLPQTPPITAPDGCFPKPAPTP